MKQVSLALLLLLIGFVSPLKGQEVAEISIKQLLERTSNNDTVYVVNFWATWCQPCVEELPIFESNELQQSDKPLKILLVSLDFKSQKEKQLIPFLDKNQVGQEVLLLDERNPNEWIDKIDSGWSGAIPATIIYKGNSKAFHEGELDLPQLLHLIDTVNL